MQADDFNFHLMTSTDLLKWLILSAHLSVRVLLPTELFSQECTGVLSGMVKDAGTGAPVLFAEVFIQELGTGDLTDDNGRFYIRNLCEGSYSVLVHHLGYEPVAEVVFVSGTETEVVFELRHSILNLEEVVVKAKAPPLLPLQLEHKLNTQQLIERQGLLLADVLAELPGIHALKTGHNISKPVVRGLHSERVLVLNQGVRLEGQEWGLDHGPEIDPYSAGEIHVIAGANSLRYGPDAIGGVICLLPKPFRKVPGIGGELNLAGFSNGKTGALSALVEALKISKKHGHTFKGRLQGTFKRGGNVRTPDYFLENTGLKETNGSATFGTTSEKLNAEIFYSYFFTELGIFKDAHIGNLTDLNLAIDRGRPTQNGSFTYQIGRPAQKVEHHLLKTSAAWRLHNLGQLELVYARQFNRRQEFDAHAPAGMLNQGLELPSLEFELTTHTLDLNLKHKALPQNLTGEAGIQLMHQVNTTDRGGLIPNYNSQAAAAFGIIHWKRYPVPLEMEFGLRFDYRRLFAERRGTKIIDKETSYHNWSGTLGAIYRISKHFRVKLHGTTAWRAPSVNELYSDGVHHGAASYELGEDDLASEKAFSTSLSLETSLPFHGIANGLDATLSAYRNYINDFIYLAPMEQPVLTIRGAFPAFRYEHADVLLTGCDLNVHWQVTDPLAFNYSLSILRARNLTTHDWLISMPSDRWRLGLEYYWFGSPNTSPASNKLAQGTLKLTYQKVSKQSRVPQGQDYADPPAGYALLDAEAAVRWDWHGHPTTLAFQVQNIFNTSFRDYLNRLRYFAEEQGRGFSVRFNLTF